MKEPLHRDRTRRLLNRRGDLFRCLDALAGDIDGAEQDLLAVQKAKQVERHLGAGTFERDLIDPARREGRDISGGALNKSVFPTSRASNRIVR